MKLLRAVIAAALAVATFVDANPIRGVNSQLSRRGAQFQKDRRSPGPLYHPVAKVKRTGTWNSTANVTHTKPGTSKPQPEKPPTYGHRPDSPGYEQPPGYKAPSSKPGKQSYGYDGLPVDKCVQCAPPTSREIDAPRENIFLGLTHDEAAAVTGFLFAQPTLNLTVAENATEWDNTVLLVELLLPNKTDALGYLDGAGPAPARYAHVVIDVRATEEPYIQDFMVGPLPLVTGVSRIKPLNYLYNKGAGIARNFNADEGTRTEWLREIAAGIEDITLDLWGLSTVKEEMYLWRIDPMWREDNRTIVWDMFWAIPVDQFSDSTLLPLGLYLKTDSTGRDASKWKVLGWFYNGIFYETTDEFRAAWSSPGFVKNGPNLHGPWAQTDREGPMLEHDTLQPPAPMAPSGNRFSIDTEKQYIEWMGFSFFIGFSRDTGMRLFDIRFKGERIIYELGLMEALAHYAGQDPTQSGTAYLDTFYGFGPYAFQLVPGFDCPEYATYLNSSFHVAEKTHTHPGSICVFEADAGYPMARHTTSTLAYVTKNIKLTVRSVCTVGNYDYQFNYIFYMDGSIGIEVRASGYIQSAYFANNDDYGFKIHDNLSGSMHDHVLNFKVDFDILGTANSIATTEIVPTTETYPWSPTKPRNTMKLHKSFLASETGLNWPYNSNKHISVVNKAMKNKYGEYRGYKIAPSTPVAHLTVLDSTNLQQAAEWAKHHLCITQRKDTEQSSAHPYNALDVEDPPINFAKYLDGESLDQEDVVVWFNLGMHHVPNTGDLPNTVFTTAHSGMLLEPVNYHLQNPSKQAVQSVRISYEDGVVKEVQRFGAEKAAGCALGVREPDLSGYRGDVVIRKFPYDPNDWWLDTESI